MENALKICFALIPFLILRAVSIVDIKYLDSLKIDFPTTIQTSVIVANGAEWELYFTS
jgi:hypothetical protein